ncbi:MAG: negative regulator of flagellin synthesis FlgM [Clostridiales bacterium]|nr:negative regulator of flagellin synthesis FlgM [Clostridiales bacterium]
MRIDAYNQIAQLYQANQAKATKAKTDSAGSFSDSLQLSQTGKDMQVAKQAVKDADDVREDKVNDLKARLASGTYNVSAEDLADKLVNQYFDEVI